MHEIKLDTSKLLGFRIVESKDASIALLSPKIGAKLCVVGDEQLLAGADAERVNANADA